LGIFRVYQNDKEGNEAIVNAIKNVPLWKTLFDNYPSKGKDLPTDTFWMDLRRIVGEDKLPPEEAKTKAEIVRKAYFEDIKYYKPEIEAKKGETGMESGKIDTSKASSLAVDRQANIVADLMNKGAFDIAKNFIDFIKSKKKESPEKED